MDAERPSISYLVCTTPRCGSTLLCETLKRTGVAGRPKEYFALVQEQSWADKWGVSGPAEYVRAAIAAGITENGVFGAKVFWRHMEAMLLEKLRAVNGKHPASSHELLANAFPNLHFIWLTREDMLAQAVSFSRALQTKEWTSNQDPVAEPRFDFEQIRALLGAIAEGNLAWQQLFEASGVEPLAVRYEDLAADRRGITQGVLAFLGIEQPAGTPTAPRLMKQADDMNAEWVARYKAMAARG